MGERILDAATELFLREGYGATSIEGVSALAGISKRTFYFRYDDKAALFAAVVHRIIQRIRPPPDVPLLEGGTLHEKLRHLAGLILRAALEPSALALHRLVTSEAARFPNLARAIYSEGWSQEAAALIGDLLAGELGDARGVEAVRGFATEQFLGMVVSVPQRRAMGLGNPMTPRELEEWAERTVRLFVGGCRAFVSAPAASPE